MICQQNFDVICWFDSWYVKNSLELDELGTPYSCWLHECMNPY
jgi:hypothetical protein